MINFEFYTYTYLDPRNPGVYEYGDYRFDYEPFYVGKGKGRRCKEHLSKSKLKEKSYKNNKIKAILNENLEPIIIKVKIDLLECVSFKYEIELIKLIGRVDLDTGPLTNHTDGGDGNSGMVVSEETKNKRSGKNHYNYGKHLSDETKKKKSESMIKFRAEHPEWQSGENSPMFGTQQSEETKKKRSEASSGEKHYNFGKHHSEETKIKLSEAKLGENNPNYGKPMSEDHRQKIAKSNTGKKLSPEHIRKREETKRRNREFKKLEELRESNVIII